MLVLFRSRRFLFLIGAQAVSNLGDWLYVLALFVLVGLKWQGSPLTISLLMLCLTIPMVILGPFTGVFADRYNRTAVMMGSNLVMACLIGVIPWLSQRWMLFVILLFAGCFESLFAPAEAGKLKETVPDHQMQQAVSISGSITQITKIVGPGVSGFIVAAWGAMSAFWLDALSFVLSTVLLLFTGLRAASALTSNKDEVHVSRDEEPMLAVPEAGSEGDFAALRVPEGEDTSTEEEGAGDTFFTRFVAGMNHMRAVPLLWSGTMILTVSLFLIQLTDSQMVVLVRILPHAQARLVGLMMGFSGGGGLLAAILSGTARWKSPVLPMGLGCLLIGLGEGLMAVAIRIGSTQPAFTLPFVAATCVGAMVAGGGFGTMYMPFQTFVQQHTPVEFIGRVFGSIGSLTTAAALIGPVVGGLLVTAIGIVPSYMVTAVTMVILALITLVGLRGVRPDLLSK